MTKIKNVKVVSKYICPIMVDAAKEVNEYLKDKVNVSFEKKLAKAVNSKNSFDMKNPDCDVMIVIGGDGTFLWAEEHLVGWKIPILGIKKGALGFLMEIQDNILSGLDRLLNGEYFIEERMKLNARLNGESVGNALNDIVVTNADPGEIQKYSIEIHGDLIEEVRADGVIVATPTGSTAYALSAGGPIIDPLLDAYEIVPICPFKLGSRPITVPADAITDIKITSDRKARLILDGVVTKHTLTKKDKLEVTKSVDKTYLIKFDRDFFKRIKEKLV